MLRNKEGDSMSTQEGVKVALAIVRSKEKAIRQELELNAELTKSETTDIFLSGALNALREVEDRLIRSMGPAE